MSEKRGKEYLNPCKTCEEKLCLGSECPMAKAEEDEEVILKKSTYFKRKNSVPPQIRSVLKKARISPPRVGKAEIQLFKKEDDPNLTIIRLIVEGKVKSVTQTQDRIDKNTVLKFRERILIKTLNPERTPEVIV